ncbi:sensor histidine kinase [Spirosoma jeollabukense]
MVGTIIHVCCWLAGLLAFLAGPVAAQQRPVHFEFGHIREQDGLLLQTVICFQQDRDGFLWVGTTNGLNRYDGTHVVRFRHQRNNPRSLLNNQIYALCEDKQGHIWATFENGISCFNKATGEFRHITTVQNQPLGICKNIRCDRAGDVWFTSRNRGLFCYETKTGAVQYFPCYPTDSTGDIRTLPNGLVEDPFQAGFWMAEIHGIRYFDTVRRQFTTYRKNPKKLSIFTPNDVSALAIDGNCLLIADHTDQCIVFYDLQHQRVSKRIKPTNPRDREDFYVASIFVDRRHKLWVSTWDARSFYMDAQTDQVTNLSQAKAEPTSLGSDFNWNGWQHPDGSVWLGTANGIAYTNTERTLYDVYDLSALFPALSDERGIISFAEEADGSWWLGSSIRGLLHYVPSTNRLDVYRLPNRTAKYPWGMPVTGLSRRGNELFVGSDHAIYRFNTQTYQFREIPLPPQARSVYLRSFRLQGDRYWVFGDGKLTFAYDIPTQRWQVYPIQSTNQDPRFLVRQSLLDRRGELWLDIYPEGFARFVPEQQCFRVTDTRQTDYENTIHSLAEDRDGSFLMATTMHGLVQYDPLRRQDLIRAENDAMTLSQSTAALPDRFGNIWVADVNVFSVITQAKKLVLNFTLPINEHTIRYDSYLFPMRNGHILSTQKGHVVEFKPENLGRSPVHQTVLLNRILLPDTIRTLYSNTLPVHLKVDENTFAIEFSVLSATTKYRYLYKLEGYDDGWNEANGQTQVNYTKIRGGDYIFRVKAVAGETETGETRLPIHIDTALYNTSWFRFILLALLLSLTYWFYRHRIRQTARLHHFQIQTTRLERDKAQIQYQNLINHLNPHFLFNSLTSLNSLIITQPKEASVFLRKLSVIYRYILQNKNKELVSLQDEVSFAQNYIDLQTARFGQALQISVNIDPVYLTAQIVPVTIQNLLENTIKHNILEDESPLYIRIYTADDTLFVMNTLQKKDFVETSNKQGLASLKSLYGYLSKRPVEVIETATHFVVGIPLL